MRCLFVECPATHTSLWLFVQVTSFQEISDNTDYLAQVTADSGATSITVVVDGSKRLLLSFAASQTVLQHLAISC
jgi:hypothetical protein